VNEPLWLQRAWVDALHFQQLKRFGGLYGVRDEGAFESALARARNQWEYGQERDIASLAAAYGFGLTRCHGYSDGNKRVGFVAMAVFLELNGVEFDAPEAEVVRIMLAVAAGELDGPGFATWIRQYLRPARPA
jgi:death-on-curing protein